VGRGATLQPAPELRRHGEDGFPPVAPERPADVEAHRARIEEGFPVGIIEEETGEVWIAVFRDPAPASHLDTANEHLLPYAGKKTVVQGLKYRADGVNVVRVGVASEY